MKKPRPLTQMELASGLLPRWANQYAEWLSGLNSFQNQTPRASFGRVKALRALCKTLNNMLAAGWTISQKEKLVEDIRTMALLRIPRL